MSFSTEQAAIRCTASRPRSLLIVSKRHLNPPGLFPSLQYGFSQAVVTPPGYTVYVSGQVAWDAQQNLIGADDIGAQTQQALRNVELALDAAGARLTDVVSLRIYLVSYDDERDGPRVAEALRAVFGTDNPPASTWVEIAGLAGDGLLVEIEATAVVSDIPGALDEPD